MEKEYHYDDLKGKEKEPVNPPLCIGWDVPVLLSGDFQGDPVGLANAALKIGYWLGVKAEKEADTPKEKLFYTVPEAAEYLKVHVNTIYNMARRRELEYYKVGTQIRIRASELEKMRVVEEARQQKNNSAGQKATKAKKKEAVRGDN